MPELLSPARVLACGKCAFRGGARRSCVACAFDTLEMAFAFHIRIRKGIDERSSPDVAPDFDPHEPGSINRLIDAWLPLTFAVNSIIRCMGESDFYPFVLSSRAVTKMGFIHELIHQNRLT